MMKNKNQKVNPNYWFGPLPKIRVHFKVGWAKMKQKQFYFPLNNGIIDVLPPCWCPIFWFFSIRIFYTSLGNNSCCRIRDRRTSILGWRGSASRWTCRNWRQSRGMGRRMPLIRMCRICWLFLEWDFFTSGRDTSVWKIILSPKIVPPIFLPSSPESANYASASSSSIHLLMLLFADGILLMNL